MKELFTEEEQIELISLATIHKQPYEALHIMEERVKDTPMEYEKFVLIMKILKNTKEKIYLSMNS